MNPRTTPQPRRRRVVTAVISITASLAALGPVAHAQVDPPACHAEPTSEQIEERRALRRAVDKMPAGWPATEVMRRQLAEPIGDLDDCDRADRRVDLMPDGWPATDVMRREIEP